MSQQILTVPQVLRLIGRSRAILYRMLRLGDFPRPIEVRGLGKARIGWEREAVEEWLRTRPARYQKRRFREVI